MELPESSALADEWARQAHWKPTDGCTAQGDRLHHNDFTVQNCEAPSAGSASTVSGQEPQPQRVNKTADTCKGDCHATPDETSAQKITQRTKLYDTNHTASERRGDTHTTIPEEKSGSYKASSHPDGDIPRYMRRNTKYRKQASRSATHAGHAYLPNRDESLPESERRVLNDFYKHSIQSVIQADDEHPDCARYRELIMQEFRESVFTPLKFKENRWVKRGPKEISQVKLTPVQGATPRSPKAIRTVGIREALLYEKIQTFLERGYIEPCSKNTEWVSRVLLVPKPNGKWCLVIDYRYVNTQLKGQNFPIPIIEDQSANQHGNFLWTLVDLEDGFHQMHVEQDSRKYTAFITPFGVDQWRVLPMGVKVAPQVFQRMVDYILTRVGVDSSRPYIDDVLTGTGKHLVGKGKLRDSRAYIDLMKSNRPEDKAVVREYLDEHFQAVRALFWALAAVELTVQPEKCHFFRTTIQYVGHVLRAGQRMPNPAKTEAIREWQEGDITTPKQLKGFLGLANWYALYIPKFAQHAAPLMEALRGKYQFEAAAVGPNGRLNPDGTPLKKRKRVKLSAKESRIVWNDAMRVGFRAINDSLVDAVNLYIPSPEGRWRIFTDAGDYAVGGTLEQEQPDGSFHPVAFFSKKLQGTGTGHGAQGQCGWTPREKETYTVVYCLLKFQAWIGGAEVMVKTDHGSILQWYKEDLCTISGPLGRRADGTSSSLDSIFNNRVPPRGSKRRRGLFVPMGVSCGGSAVFKFSWVRPGS